jgi:enoyl-CoA hydratase/carnithine racemase
MSDVVLSERRGPVAVVTLNRPDRLNAWTGELGERYYALLDECAADPDVRVIVVTGAGRGFCAGADMDDLQGLGGPRPDDVVSAARPSRPVYHATTLPKIVIAAVNGACAGLGFVHALMCDLRFAASGAKFTSAFSRRGLIAEWGSSWVLPRLVGPARAMDVLVSGRVFLAEEAYELGIVNRVVEPERLLDEVLEYAADLAVNVSPASMAVMKRQVWQDLTRTLPEAHDDSVQLMLESFGRPDFKEGVQSFVEKRAPDFPPYGAS